MSKENALFHQVKEHIAFDTLWSQVMDTVTTLSGKHWTDTGEHDPGITLLQAITWNCSDLSYRTSLSLTDLLTEVDQQTLFPAEFGPHNILTCNAITAEDYRRMLRDMHSSDTALRADNPDFLFRDAYLTREPKAGRFHWWYNAEKREYTFTEPADVGGDDKRELNLRGNYELYLLPTRFTQALSQADRTIIEEYLRLFLDNHRNLGEAVSRIIWLQPAAFSPQFTVELSADVSDVNLVVAQIYQTLETLLLPAARHQTTAQMQAAGYSNEAIFEGPFLQHGWQQASPTLISEQGMTLNLSQLFNQLLGITEVGSISQFTPGSLPAQIKPVNGDSWSWQADVGYYPQLWGDDPLTLLASADSPLRFIAKGGIQAVPDAGKVAEYLTPAPLIQMESVILPAGDVRNLAHYTATGQRLPGCYQLQEPNDLINDAVRELHQFLLPVDQLLADGGAELAALPRLLAFTGRDESNVIRGTRWPYDVDSVNQQVHQSCVDNLERYQQEDVAIITESGGLNQANYGRELNFIDYLLGYFGTRRAARPLTLDPLDFLATQRAYLAQQPSLGYDRINIRIDQVSALQKRIAARIGLNHEIFADDPNLGKLPFYLIEHRQLMPRLPDELFNSKQTPSGFSVQGSVVSVTQKGVAGKLFRGQLIELIAIEEVSELHVGPLLITEVKGENFTLSTDNNQQLARDLDRLQKAWTENNLSWKNSNIWLQDMNYRLNYADEQPADGNQRTLSSNDQTPYPAMVAKGDEIIIRPASLGTKAANRTASVDADEWMKATVIACDVVTGTVLIEKTADSNDFPSADQAWRYQWNFTDAAYASTDRFSFSVSIVNNRALIDNSNIDPYRLIDWLLDTIMPEFPAHVSLITHWLSETAFNDFGLTYQRWQNSGNPLGDDAYNIMNMLTLGHLPVTQLGIGLMRIATETQKTQVMGEDGNEWNTVIILNEELLHVPQDVPTV